MLKSLFILSVGLAICFADDASDLNDNDFEKTLATHGTTLIMFYAPWCGHCKRLKPDFEKAATLLLENDPPVHLVKVDCTEGGKETCNRFSVSGYPTLKIFRGGEFSSDYNGPREFNGIVKFMRSQVGPSSKELTSVKDTESFLEKNEVGVVYFGEDSKLKETFLKLAEKLRETVRFAHSLSVEINDKYGHKEAVVLFRPKVMQNKFEESQVVYAGDKDDRAQLEDFVKKNFHGLVGHRTQDTAPDFKTPNVIVYYSVDYVKNAKGTNYWRNRVLKVAQNYASDFTFAISNKDDFQNEVTEFGIELTSGDKPVVCAKDAKGGKFSLKEEFSVETFEQFLKDLKAGKLEAFLKSEPIPTQDGPVTIAVGKNFDEVVTDNGKDTLIEFYAPWCGHCKKLTPIYDELAEKMKGEDVAIVKMDATANDVPPMFEVKGFPTLFWKPKNGSPVAYNGGRELDDFVQYIAKHSTEELSGFDRNGKAKKSEL